MKLCKCCIMWKSKNEFYKNKKTCNQCRNRSLINYHLNKRFDKYLVKKILDYI